MAAARPQLPAVYNDAKRALAAIARVDIAKDYRNKAIALEVYAMQAKDAELIAPAVKMRKHAERRIGQIIIAESKAGKLAKPTGGKRVKGQRVSKKPDDIPTLADRGVDKNLADRARKAAKMGDEKFDKLVDQSIAISVAACIDDRAVISAARDARHRARSARRAARERELAAKILALPEKRYGVIVADPEWKFEGWSGRGLDASSAANHYPVSPLEVIKSRNVASIAAPDCALFLWATQPMLPHALEVMAAWGFEYKSHVIWRKDRTGTGYWFINQHEVLLVGARGKIPAPADGTQWRSVIDAPRGEHSAKPEIFLELVESYFPTLPKIELNRRGPPRDGWEAWGNEAEAAA